MKTTNAIEQALKEKAGVEIDQLVSRFIQDIQTNITDKYRTSGFWYDLRESGCSDSPKINVKATLLDSVLKRMLTESHLDRMVERKSAELINKLNLDI